MDEDRLISKKEVLESMGISYGQLYRWKRKGLIPEVWFIRRSTFTGQETFFPRDKIIERIRRIKEMKDDHPLDDLAELITERVNAKLKVAFGELRKMGWLDEGFMESCRSEQSSNGTVSIREALCLGVLSQLHSKARPEEAELVRRTLDKEMGAGLLDRIPDQGTQLILLRKRLSGSGISAEISVAALGTDAVRFDPECEVVKMVDLAVLLQRIQLDLAGRAAPSDEPTPNPRSEQEEEA